MVVRGYLLFITPLDPQFGAVLTLISTLGNALGLATLEGIGIGSNSGVFGPGTLSAQTAFPESRGELRHGPTAKNGYPPPKLGIKTQGGEAEGFFPTLHNVQTLHRLARLTLD